MSKPEDCAFAFEEADHLTRIHLKLALEDMGFIVEEEKDVIAIAADAGDHRPAAPPRPAPFRRFSLVSDAPEERPIATTCGEASRD